MAAPSIPNLNSLRGGRGRGRGRGLSSLGGPSTRTPEAEKARNDQIVQQTDEDASLSRLSAVNAGYLEDPFARLFVTSEVQRRFPIINRGTYVRTKAIDKLVEQFLTTKPTQRKQIISLGAGTDTRYFRIMLHHQSPGEPRFIYHELDFPKNTARKLREVKRHTELASALRPPISYSNTSNLSDDPANIVDSQYYYVHPIDLRDLDPTKEPPPTFEKIDRSLPTLVLSECCLVYLEPAAADIVAQYFSRHLFPSSTPLGIVLYEPINPNDAFGKVMVSNLAARGIVLQTLKKYGSLEAQAARMNSYGFMDSRGADVDHLWEKGVHEMEKERVARLEMVDEVEEWKLLAGHYAVVWGWRDGELERGQSLWEPWKDLFL